MKYDELKIVINYIAKFKKIFAIERVDDTVIKFVFDKSEPIYADLRKGNSTFFMAPSFLRQKIYNAPFDVLLIKYFAKSIIKDIKLLQNNRIIQIFVESKSHYKSAIFILQLEFTGRNTNAIILNENNVVIEALRHIGEKTSFRPVIVGEKLLPLPPFVFKKIEMRIDDIPAFLHEVYEKNKKNQLEFLKNHKILQVQKKKEKLSLELESLPHFDELQKQAKNLNEDATLILTHLNKIKAYEKEVKLVDFNGNERCIFLPKEAINPQNGANLLFEKSKKLKQKASGIHIQKENLEEKISFYERLIDLLREAKSTGEANILFSKQKKRRKKDEKRVSYEIFYIEEYKIMVGKSQKSNIELFKDARKRDIWLHVKDFPSSHVIVRTNKYSLPQHILDFAAKLCVNFSTSKQGTYLVDYTKWQNVKIQSGSKVFYTDFKSIKVVKEVPWQFHQ